MENDYCEIIDCFIAPINCPASDFQCTGTALGNVIECIDRRLRCDGYADCTDGSDEENCRKCFTHSHTITPFDAPGKQSFGKHCGKGEIARNEQFLL